jgi:hypothetical protein
MPQAGDTIRALDFPATQEADVTADETGISSTTYIPGGSTCSTTFLVGTSGKVEIKVNARIHSDGTNRIWLAYELYQGTSAGGTLIAAANDNNAVATKTSGAEEGQSISKTHTGLVVGATHFVRTVHRVAGGSGGALTHRRIIVGPVN